MKRDQVMGIHAVEALLKTSPERLTRVWMQPREGRLMQLHTQLQQALYRTAMVARWTACRTTSDIRA